MSIIREEIKYIGLDVKLNFGLSSNDSFLGFQQEIDNLTQVVSNDLINPPIDVEVRKIKYPSYTPTDLSFQFTSDGINYATSFINAGFTQEELESSSPLILNSFFIVNLYNSYNVYNQIKICTNYITKVINSQTSQNTPQYSVSKSSVDNNQWFNLYIPKSYIDNELERLKLSGITNGLITGYTSFNFFNAKSGDLTLFYNTQNSGSTTPLRMYFQTIINLKTRTWKFESVNTIIAKQLSSSAAYVNRNNDTFTTFDDLKQNYPQGTKFNAATGGYD